MAAINFPNNPTLNQQFTVGGTTYVWDGEKWKSTSLLTVTETDPTVPSHVKGISLADIGNWNDAFSWGNHALAGYASTSNVVTLSGTQTITGAKTFSGGISGDGSGLFSVNAAELNGQLPSYYLDHTNFINVPDPTITLTGDMSGSITLTDLSGGFLDATFTGRVPTFDVLDVRDLSGSGGASTYHPSPNDLPDNRVSAYFGYMSESSWQSSLTVKGWSDGYTAWELIGPCNTSTSNKWYLRSGTSTSWGTAYEIYHEGHKPTAAEIGAASSSHTHNYLPLSGGNLSGTVNFDTVGYYLNFDSDSTTRSTIAWTSNSTTDWKLWHDDDGALRFSNESGVKTLKVEGDFDVDNRAVSNSSLMRVICDDAGTAELRCQGPASGTGRVYVGQSTTYGGGIEYAGDGNDPGNSGAGSDHITLFRVSGGTNASPNRIWTARNQVGSNNWDFRGKVISQGGNSGSWGSGMGETTGAFTAAIPNDTSAAWVWSASSGTTFRCGFQMYNGGSLGRLYIDTNSYYVFHDGDFTAQGDITAFSDIRVKENIRPIENAMSAIRNLNGVLFNRIGKNETVAGFIAQEWEQEFPWVVKKDEDGMLSLAYGNTAALLLEGMKEVDNDVAELERKVDEQQQQIDFLMNEIKAIKGH